MSDVEDETSSSSEDEDPEIDETEDQHFFRALSCLKNKDPKIYDPEVRFFPADGDVEKGTKKKKKEKKDESKSVFLRDYEREAIVKVMAAEEDESEVEDEVTNDDDDELPYVEQQNHLKASFKAALEDAESSESEDDLLTLKKKTAEEKEKEEEDYKLWLKGNKEELSDEETKKDLKPLQKFWSNPNLDSNEQFLRDYILNRRYMEGDEEIEDDGISEDGELLEKQEQFETDYNFRFENETNEGTKRYPRTIEGSLRKKNESRKKKRRERLKRKQAEKEKMKEEIAKKQKEKLLEFKEQVEKIKKLTGNDQLGFKDDEIFGDEEFDPEAHDKKMQALYSDAFYAAGDDDVKKPDFSDEDLQGYEGEENDADPDNMDLEATTNSSKVSRSKRKRKEKKKKTFSDIMDVAKPVYDPQVHDSFQKYIDEYYSMDCEDFIEDIPCRFKYREVVPNDFGLTVEEILAADDKELNQWVSAKKITQLRPEHVEKNEVKIYKKKGQDFNLKKKILSSVYASPPRDEGADESTDVAEKEDVDKKKNQKRKNDVESDQQSPEFSKKKKTKLNSESNNINPNKATNGPRKKKTKKGRSNINVQSRNDPVAGVSDLRLKAYNIKPKEFKKKLKFKKTE